MEWQSNYENSFFFFYLEICFLEDTPQAPHVARIFRRDDKKKKKKKAFHKHVFSQANPKTSVSLFLVFSSTAQPHLTHPGPPVQNVFIQPAIVPHDT